MAETIKAPKGLEGVIADQSSVSYVDVENKKLMYRGYDINTLCENSNFLEVAYLLIFGKLPNAKEFQEFEDFEKANREVPDSVYEALKKLPKHVHPMDYLRIAVSLATAYDEENTLESNSLEDNLRKAKTLFAKMPTLVANSYRLVNQLELVRPNPHTPYVENFLTMIRGSKVENPLMNRVFDTTLILYAEHSFNASTFSARVTASTLSDFYSAVVSAIGTLKGPLHGGANEAVMHMLLEIGEPSKAESYVLAALAQKKKLMGFGHRLYRKGDSRTEVIKNLGLKLAQELHQTKWYDIEQIMENTMIREKNIFCNLDFPVAPAYYLLGIPIDLFTPIFAASRIAGWAAHIIEQHDNNRLIRPSCEYIGEKTKQYIEINKR